MVICDVIIFIAIVAMFHRNISLVEMISVILRSIGTIGELGTLHVN